MKGKSGRENRPTDLRERIEILLRDLWGGNQRSMAAAVGCSQAALSMIVNGKRPPGRKLIELIAAYHRVNPEWLRRGSGEPILAEASLESLPIAEEVLPGPPLDHRQRLLPERHPVSSVDFAPTRYWLRVRRYQPVTLSEFTKVRADDLILMESDLNKFPFADFRGLAAVRLPKGNETEVRLCRIWPDSQGPGGKTLFNVEPFLREAMRRALVRKVTIWEYPDGTGRTSEAFEQVVPEQQEGKKATERWRTSQAQVRFYFKVWEGDIVAVALQLVRTNP